jgi:ArsR family transcriptional regulator, arsenate/arsenite/antimonite-responsive transcriptional repressor
MPVARMEVRPIAAMLRALGDESRLRIVALLGQGELCVCHLHTALARSQPHVSRHLAVLRAAGLVEARRQGSWVHYRLAAQIDPARRRVMRALLRALPAEVLRGDVDRLRRSRGPLACG